MCCSPRWPPPRTCRGGASASGRSTGSRCSSKACGAGPSKPVSPTGSVSPACGSATTSPTRTPPPTCWCSPRTPRRTAWWSPRLWRADSQSSRRRSAGCRRLWAGRATAADLASWCRPATARRWRPRCAAGWPTPTSERDSGPRRGSVGRPCPAGMSPAADRACAHPGGGVTIAASAEPRIVSRDAAGAGTAVGVVARWLGGAAIVALVVWRLGTGPFLDGLRAVDGEVVGVGGRYRVRHDRVRGLAMASRRPRPRGCRAAAHRDGGVLPLTTPQHRDPGWGARRRRPSRTPRQRGRAMSAGASGPSPGSARLGSSCSWGSGSTVLLLLPSRVPTWLPLVVAAVLVGVLGGGLLLSGRPPRGPSRAARAFRAAAGDIRDGLLARRHRPGIALASVVVVTGHLATLLLAARTAGAISPIRPVAAAGRAGVAGDGGADQHRRLGSSGGRGRLGVRCRRPRRRPGRRDDHRVRRPASRSRRRPCSLRLAPAPAVASA